MLNNMLNMLKIGDFVFDEFYFTPSFGIIMDITKAITPIKTFYDYKILWFENTKLNYITHYSDENNKINTLKKSYNNVKKHAK